MNKLWLISGGGGFSWESRELGNQLESYFDVYYIFPNESYEGRESLPTDRTVFVPTLTARYHINFIKKLKTLLV
mgnify:CR=1 FL=1